MPTPALEQALATASPAGLAVTARSPGFLDDWVDEVGRLAAAVGTPTEPLTAAVVAAGPLGTSHVAVVQAVAPKPPEVLLHVVVVPVTTYRQVGDPFFLAEHYPAPWGETFVLPSLPDPEDLPDRTIERVRRVLQEDDAPTLLGAAQALVDGGRVVFERPFPAPDLLRRLWVLLPHSTRAELWPASFAAGAPARFHAVVVPKLDAARLPGFLTEVMAGDYPEGRYELGVQSAAEAGDQRALDALFNRRTSRETLRLAVVILALMMALAVAVRFL